MKHKILLLLATITQASSTVELERDAFMHVMKERVIQFPEESQKLSYINNELQYEDNTSLLEPNATAEEEELPKLKDTFQTTLLSRSRRSRNGQRVSYRTRTPIFLVFPTTPISYTYEPYSIYTLFFSPLFCMEFIHLDLLNHRK